MLRNRQFQLLWVINVAVTLAIELLSVSILVSVYEQTSSTLQAAGAMVVRTIINFILGPIAGVLVDRFPRKNVLIVMDFFRLIMVVVMVWFLQGSQQLPIIWTYILLAGLSAAGVFHQPARLALIPSLVKKSELIKANSFILVTNQIVLAISYIAGGWLVQIVSFQFIVFGITVLFLISILVAIIMNVPRRKFDEDAVGSESFLSSLWEGWKYLSRHSLAGPLTIMETIEHIPHGVWTGALLLAFTTQVLHGDSVDWGFQQTGYYSGMIVGSLVALASSKWLEKYPGRIIILNAGITALISIIFANTQSIAAAFFWSFLFGPANAIRDVAQDSLLQATVDNRQLGRVYATREMLRSIVFMFSGIFFAFLSNFISIRLIFYFGGILYGLTYLYAFTVKALRESTMIRQAFQNN